MKSFLIDGPMMLTIERRKAMTQRMATDLIELGAPLEDDHVAARFLFNNGYSMFDAALLAGEARALAFQDVVAREMGKS